MRETQVRIGRVYRDPILGLVRIIKPNRPYWTVRAKGKAIPYNYVKHQDLTDDATHEELQEFIEKL